VEKCAQHPGKMWVVDGDRMVPLLSSAPASTTPQSGGGGLVAPKPQGEGGPETQPWHSTPYQALPPVYVQNASLEIAWSRVVFDSRTIAGDVVVPFVTGSYEGFDINDPADWMIAEKLLADGAVQLPAVPQVPYGSGIRV